MSQKRWFTFKEDQALAKFMAEDKRYMYMGGNKIWSIIEKKNVCPGRTKQSLKDRFRRTIMSNLGSYGIEQNLRKQMVAFWKASSEGKRQIRFTEGIPMQVHQSFFKLKSRQIEKQDDEGSTDSDLDATDKQMHAKENIGSKQRLHTKDNELRKDRPQTKENELQKERQPTKEYEHQMKRMKGNDSEIRNKSPRTKKIQEGKKETTQAHNYQIKMGSEIIDLTEEDTTDEEEGPSLQKESQSLLTFRRIPACKKFNIAMVVDSENAAGKKNIQQSRTIQGQNDITAVTAMEKTAEVEKVQESTTIPVIGEISGLKRPRADGEPVAELRKRQKKRIKVACRKNVKENVIIVPPPCLKPSVQPSLNSLLQKVYSKLSASQRRQKQEKIRFFKHVSTLAKKLIVKESTDNGDQRLKNRFKNWQAATKMFLDL